jgi:uncharacterized FlaG/YvyC family protein
MEIPGIKENPFREAPPLSEKKPAEKPVPPREEPVSVQKEFPKIDLARNEKAVKALAESLNSFMKSMSYSLQFVPDRENGRVVVKVLDSDGKVVRQIPPESLGELADNVGAKTGIVVNETLK